MTTKKFIKIIPRTLTAELIIRTQFYVVTSIGLVQNHLSSKSKQNSQRRGAMSRSLVKLKKLSSFRFNSKFSSPARILC